MDINVGYIATVFFVSIGSIILHELAHGLMALALGDQTARLSGRLTLNPLKHIDPVMSIIVPVFLALIGAPVFGGAKPVPINTRNLRGGEWGFALVALAGPLMNIILAFIFFLIGYLSGNLGIIEGTGSLGMVPNACGMICSTGMLLNIGFAMFNIIPIPPLDGSRVLYALAPEKVQDFMRQLEQYGIIVIYLLIVFCGTFFTQFITTGRSVIIDFFCWIVGAH